MSFRKLDLIDKNERNCYNCIHCRGVIPLKNNKKSNSTILNLKLDFKKIRIFCRKGYWFKITENKPFIYRGIYNSKLKKFKEALSCPFFELDD